ncbi:MAG: FAD:protein FMN transferase [Sulfurisoma sp.]|nr:FAD:protein FMN transferase [Sulfurisoma sp.]
MAEAELGRIEALWSRYRDDSIVSRINAAAGRHGVDVDAETALLIDYAAVAWQTSAGLFDITSGALRRVWRFTGTGAPTAEAITACLPSIGWGRAHWIKPELFLPQSGMEIDLGGLGKEYAADRIATLWRECGFAGLINLGGDIVATGTAGQEAWRIGIQHPRRPGELAAVLPLTTGALATSGDYERCLVIDGRRYCHVLNPFTGWPAGELASVTVLAPTCLVAGTLATTAMLKGKAGAAWLAELGVQHMVIPDAPDTARIVPAC